MHKGSQDADATGDTTSRLVFSGSRHTYQAPTPPPSFSNFQSVVPDTYPKTFGQEGRLASAADFVSLTSSTVSAVG